MANAPTYKQPSKEAFEKWFNTLPHDLASVVKETPRDLAEKAFAAGADSERAKARLDEEQYEIFIAKLVDELCPKRILPDGMDRLAAHIAIQEVLDRRLRPILSREQPAERKEQP